MYSKCVAFSDGKFRWSFSFFDHFDQRFSTIYPIITMQLDLTQWTRDKMHATTSYLLFIKTKELTQQRSWRTLTFFVLVQKHNKRNQSCFGELFQFLVDLVRSSLFLLKPLGDKIHVELHFLYDKKSINQLK